ncbi:rod shape-determining protein MreC [Faecalibacter bovis]|uniref:Cell shape-determining protein MreC n=1 Tax=Faecalibacter bovis TaxID=2898187 RepID=A0ABX7XE24_9FLAO|nr:rod shape-determining protein MreC [Faecalibacter bovis]QTV06017.1 rod shape-determining protein MreC [Faecalibacter bovis]
MQYILNAIRKNGVFIIFVFLEFIALFLVFRKNIYHETILAEASTSFTGFTNNKIAAVTNFVNLPSTNKDLQEENAMLRERLVHLGIKDARTKKFTKVDSLGYQQTYSFIPAEVINNSIIKTQNYITIDKGRKDGVEKGDGIITNKGVIGIITFAGQKYSRAISLLNKDIRVNARIKGNEYFGTLIWDGKDARYAQLTEIPKYIKVNKGDTIETDGKSPVFPEGLMIGTVISKANDNVTGELKIQVKLKQDFGNLSHAYVVTNLNKIEIKQVEKSDTIINNVQ